MASGDSHRLDWQARNVVQYRHDVKPQLPPRTRTGALVRDDPELTDATLLELTLPAAWAAALERLNAFNALVTSSDRTDPVARDEAAALRQQILTSVSALHETAPQRLQSSSRAHQRTFCEAVLLWTRFAAAGGEVLKDTLGNETLARFPVDFDPAPADLVLLKTALTRAFGYTSDEIAEIDKELAFLTSNLTVKHALARALVDALDGDPLALFHRMYGAVPFRPGDVDVIITSASIVFSLPARAQDLAGGEREVARPQAELDQVDAFLRRAARASKSVGHVRFPVFGLFELDAVQPSLWRELIDAVRQTDRLADIDDEVVRQTLKTMVVTVPKPDVDAFLTHDVWGHGWQETLCEFEWLFQRLEHLADPLDAAVLRSAIRVGAGGVVLDEEALVAAVNRDLRARIEVGLNLVVAESLADLIEHKLVRGGSALPTTSMLPRATLKIDLTILDLAAMTRLWRRPYRRLRRDDERSRLAAELRASGLEQQGLDAAISQASDVIDREFSQAFKTKTGVRVEVRDGAIAVTVLQRLLCAAASLDEALTTRLDEGEQRYRELTAGGPKPRWHCPTACVDLMAVSLAWFYERDRQSNIWRLDELARDELWASMLALEEALAVELAG